MCLRRGGVIVSLNIARFTLDVLDCSRRKSAENFHNLVKVHAFPVLLDETFSLPSILVTQVRKVFKFIKLNFVGVLLARTKHVSRVVRCAIIVGILRKLTFT